MPSKSHSGNFGNRNVKMPFGRHRGEPVSKLPNEHLHWLLNLADLGDWLRTAVELEWRRRWHAQWRSHTEASAPPFNILAEDRELLAELIHCGYRVLAHRYHPDVGGDVDAMRRLNLLVERLRRALAA
jgi:hypothetical protein